MLIYKKLYLLKTIKDDLTPTFVVNLMLCAYVHKCLYSKNLPIIKANHDYMTHEKHFSIIRKMKNISVYNPLYTYHFNQNEP